MYDVIQFGFELKSTGMAPDEQEALVKAQPRVLRLLNTHRLCADARCLADLVTSGAAFCRLIQACFGAIDDSPKLLLRVRTADEVE